MRYTKPDGSIGYKTIRHGLEDALAFQANPDLHLEGADDAGPDDIPMDDEEQSAAADEAHGAEQESEAEEQAEADSAGSV